MKDKSVTIRHAVQRVHEITRAHPCQVLPSWFGTESNNYGAKQHDKSKGKTTKQQSFLKRINATRIMDLQSKPHYIKNGWRWCLRFKASKTPFFFKHPRRKKKNALQLQL
jgi:hypothetical protein